MNSVLYLCSTATARKRETVRGYMRQSVYNETKPCWLGLALGVLAVAGELMNAQDLIYYLDSDI